MKEQTGKQQIAGEEIYWRLQNEADLTLPARAFLDGPELQQLARLTVPSRRRDWLLGRHTAKTLIQDYLRRAHDQVVAPGEVSIITGADGAPRALARGQRISLSISHRAGWSLCALTRRPNALVGADVELVEPRSRRFVQDFFTDNERQQVRAAGVASDEVVTTLWSAKEAALKALHLGLTVDTRRADCHLTGASSSSSSWNHFLVRYTAEKEDGRDPPVLHGCWRRHGPLVLTLARATGQIP